MPYANFPEDFLLAARKGDEKAENQLFLQLRARILTLVQYKLRNVQKHSSEVAKDVEEIVEEVLDTIRENYLKQSFTDGFDGFMKWVNKIIWNKVGDYIRKERKKAQVETKLEHHGFDFIEVAVSPDDLPDTILEKKEFINIISKITCKALEKIDGHCKVVMKALLEGKIKTLIKSWKDAGMSDEAIYSRIHRCRKKFKKLLENAGILEFLREEGYDL